MVQRVQHVRHATAAADLYLGLEGEFTADLTKKEIRYHDGVTVGGVPLARADHVNETVVTVKAADFDANTILMATADDTPITLTVAEQTLVGRITSGAITALTATQIRALLNVEDGADVTDATNVAAALTNGVAALTAAEVAQMANIGSSVIALADWVALQNIVLNNFAASTAPAASDDDAAGYAVGSVWIDTTADKAYKCVDASTGVAIWKAQFGPGTGDMIGSNNLSELTNFVTARATLGVEIGVDVQAYDATILNAADIGVSVQAYDATILIGADIGVNVQAYDATILVDADIGGSVMAYAANNATSSSINTFTNKTFDANGTGNSLSNVDVADLAAGTDGELITWNAAGNPAVVATGTAAQVLTSNGAGAAPTFQAAAGGGAWDLIGTSVASASASLTVTGLDSTYDKFAVGFDDMVPATDNVKPWLRVGDAGGIDSGGSDYSYVQRGYSSSTTAANITISTAAAQILMHANSSGNLGNAAGEGWGGLAYINRPGDGSVKPIIHGASVGIMDTPASAAIGGEFSGARQAVIALDRVQFLFSSGNIVSGRMTVWGIKHA